MNVKTIAAAALAATGALAVAGLATSQLKTRSLKRRSPPPGRLLEVNGTRLHVMQEGSGPDVLLIHGAAMAAPEMMLALGDALPGYRLTAIDRPGHGWSDKRRFPSIHDQAELFHAAAVELGLKSPVVVGHSLGGAVALAYGQSFVEETSGVVAIAPLAFPGWGPAHLGRMIRGAPVLGPVLSNTTLALSDPAMLRAVLPLIFSPQKVPPTLKEAFDIDILTRPSAMVADGADFTRASLDLSKLSRSYAEYPVPVHVVVGGKDHILKPSRQAERLAAAIPLAKLTRREGLGHMVHHFAPDAVRIAIADVRTRSLEASAPAMAA